jgi:uncharacterized membrane protein
MTFFGHPLHPMTSHFPIAFYILGVFLTIVYLWRDQHDVERFAYWSFGLSWLAVLFSSLVGLIRRGSLNNHITAGVILLIINGLLLYMRFRWPNVLTHRRWPYLGLMAAGLVAVLVTAWLGGELVYGLGVGVR